MGEKLNKFIAFYTEKATASVNEKKAKVDTYKAERQKAIDTLKLGVSDKYPTLGNLVKDMFPENGGVDNTLFNNLYANLSGLSEEDKKIINNLNTLSKSQAQYNKANLLLTSGGEKYFNELLDVLKENTSLDNIIKGGIKGLNTFLAELDTVPESPPGIESSQELFDAIVEANSSVSKTEPVKSPINQETTEEQGKEQPASQINAAESPAKVETGAPSSAITTAEASPLSTEPESIVQSATASINTPVESPTAEVIPAKTEMVSQVNQPEIIVGEKEIAQIQAEKARQEKVSSAITETIKQFSVSEEKKTEISKILGEFAAKQKGEAAAPPATALERELQKFGEIRQNFQNLFAPTTTAVSSTGTTINTPTSTNVATTEFTNITQGSTSTFAESNVINNVDTKTTSSPLQLTEAQQSIVNQFRQKFNIMTPEEKKKQEEVRRTIEQSIKVEGGQPILKTVKEPESTVERGTVQFDQKIPATSVQTTSIANNQNIQNIPQEVRVAEVTSTPQPITGGTQMTTPPSEAVAAGGQPPINIDLSELSKRLRNLEELLSAPLTVKIA